MNRRTFLANTGALFLTAPLAAEAQGPVKIPRVGYLTTLARADDWRLQSFQQGLRELGYVEGDSTSGQALVQDRGESLS